MTIDAIAEAFSGHRFADAYPFLADDVRWELVGGPTLDRTRRGASRLRGDAARARGHRRPSFGDSGRSSAASRWWSTRSGSTAIRTVRTPRLRPATSSTSPTGGSSGSRPTRSNCPTRTERPSRRAGRLRTPPSRHLGPEEVVEADSAGSPGQAAAEFDRLELQNRPVRPDRPGAAGGPVEGQREVLAVPIGPFGDHVGHDDAVVVRGQVQAGVRWPGRCRSGASTDRGSRSRRSDSRWSTARRRRSPAGSPAAAGRAGMPAAGGDPRPLWAPASRTARRSRSVSRSAVR